MSGPTSGPLPGEPWGPPPAHLAGPRSEPVVAHRNTGLRIALAAVAAAEAGAALTIVQLWTPGRAAVAGVALGLGAIAALVAVVVMGTARPIGSWLRASITVVLIGSCLLPYAARSATDPTQATIPDLQLSVACTVAPDAQSVTATVEYVWRQVDLWPAGLAGARGTDSIQVSAELPEWIVSELDAAPPSIWLGGGGTATGYWSIASLDERPFGVLPVLSSGNATLTVSDAMLRAGDRYRATWTFARDFEQPPPGKTLADMMPIFVVEYGHMYRFRVEAFGSCGDASRSWPNRSITWNQY